MSSSTDTPSQPSSKGLELPPESNAWVWTRRLIILAFWVVAVCLGLPHWTWTTSIHRSELPLDSMKAWVEGGACIPSYPLRLNLKAADLDSVQASQLVSATQLLLNERKEFPFYSFELGTDQRSEPKEYADHILAVNVQTTSAPDVPQSALDPWTSTLNVKHSLLAPHTVSRVAEYLANEILRLFQDEGSALSYLLLNSPYAGRIPLQPVKPEKRAALDARTTRAFKYASTYHLTFSLFTPAGSPSAWEIDEAVQQYISPLLAPLSAISKLKVDTQVQLYASFAPSIAGPTLNAADNTWRLQYSDLTGFINAAEWPLSPSIGSGLTINFVLYVPSPDKSPLLIEEGGGTDWMIPQWGGVRIHNPSSNESSKLTASDLEQDMLVFADQLASLLGVPASPPSLPFRISSLTRERATSLILSASSTLGALARLTFKLTSIAIPDSVAQSVHETVNRLDSACADLKAGRYQSALENARIAEEEAEKAFFEPSMVGQVYFPEEHKVAVYVPLLGPMAVPLIMAGIKELKSIIKQRKAKAT